MFQHRQKDAQNAEPVWSTTGPRTPSARSRTVQALVVRLASSKSHSLPIPKAVAFIDSGVGDEKIGTFGSQLLAPTRALYPLRHLKHTQPVYFLFR
ncbi:hypothetical protein BJX99DRAFT_151587 [Aspergillus californicus]